MQDELIGNRQVVLLTTRGNAKKELAASVEEKDDVSTVMYHMPCSDNLYAIALKKDSHSYELIHEAHCFVVNFVTEGMKEEAEFCGTVSGRRIDKVSQLGLEMEEGRSVDCPHLKNAIGYLECKVVNRIECEDYELFIGRIVNSNMDNPEAKRLFSSDVKGI